MNETKKGRGQPRKAPTTVIRVQTSLASIIKEKGTGWVLEVLQREIERPYIEGFQAFIQSELERGK